MVSKVPQEVYDAWNNEEVTQDEVKKICEEVEEEVENEN
jgi:hypothetical protein